MELEVKELIEKGLENVKSEVQKSAGANEIAVKEIKEANEAVKVQVTDLVDRSEKMQSHLDALDVKLQKKGGTLSGEQKSFNDYVAEAISDNAEKLSRLAKSTKIDDTIEMKAAGDMSYASNFVGNAQVPMVTEYRQNVLMQPDKTRYLREIIPGGQTDGSSIWYPRHIGGEGEPKPWKEGEKPQFDFDFDAVNTPVEWIAGFVRVPRQMLDDVKWLTSFLQVNMLKALYKSENKQILNGDGVSPNLLGLMPQAQEYNGTYTPLIEKIVDSVAQVGDNEHDANYILLNHRDAVAIALNKASGSGEYDLPPGTVGYVNGQLSIAGLNVLTMPSSQLATGQYLVGDFNAAQLVTRLSPEIRFFDQDGDNARKNMVTIRIEERVALATYFPKAFVKNKTTV
ncbi:phage major capsid protein [Elizabethkingia anophelis]|nr:phage major capsid protein [Elizabethkingia anophelis]